MLNEDGLFLVAALAACALVVLGTLELIWPTRPRHPRRRSMGRDPARGARPQSTAPPKAAGAPAGEDATAPDRRAERPRSH